MRPPWLYQATFRSSKRNACRWTPLDSARLRQAPSPTFHPPVTAHLSHSASAGLASGRLARPASPVLAVVGARANGVLADRPQRGRRRDHPRRSLAPPDANATASPRLQAGAALAARARCRVRPSGDGIAFGRARRTAVDGARDRVFFQGPRPRRCRWILCRPGGWAPAPSEHVETARRHVGADVADEVARGDNASLWRGVQADCVPVELSPLGVRVRARAAPSGGLPAGGEFGALGLRRS